MMTIKKPSSVFEILYQDEHYVAISKPSGMLVHRTRLVADRHANSVCAMVLLRDQLGKWVYPVHRIDRATSGILLFALNSESAKKASLLFENRKVQKKYLAIVRGHVVEKGSIEKKLKEQDTNHEVVAISHYRCLHQFELQSPVGRYPTARYSIVEVNPETGRYHQIRKHFSSLRHPIIGDTTYGDGKHNRFFREHFSVNRLLLHALSLEFTHPYTQRDLQLQAPLDSDFEKIFQAINYTPMVCLPPSKPL